VKLSELSKAELGSVQQRFAIASDVYEDDSPEHQLSGGWQKVFKSSEVKGLEDRGFGGAVYKRTIGGKPEYVVAFRGMDGIKDLNDVALLALGKAPAQVTDAYRFVQEAQKKLNFDPVEAEYVGHSMGGYLSKAIGLLNGSKRVTAFNSPGLFVEDLEGLPARIKKEFGENKADITHDDIAEGVLSIDSKFDIVSWAGQLRGNTIRITTLGRPHALDTLERGFNRAAEGLRAEDSRRIAAGQNHGGPVYGGYAFT
jgi:hypothetical protein